MAAKNRAALINKVLKVVKKHYKPVAPPKERSLLQNLLFACWLIATGSALGSLFFSDVMGFPPCVLCWYQRIAIFPLVLILPMGLFPFDASAAKFALRGFTDALRTELLHDGSRVRLTTVPACAIR